MINMLIAVAIIDGILIAVCAVIWIVEKFLETKG
jgi:hypothetical protein